MTDRALVPTTQKELVDQTQRVTLEDLFAQAEQLGKIYLFSSDFYPPPERYRVKIQFQTIAGTNLEAASDFGLSVFEAFSQAIERAEAIRGQFK